MGDSMTTNEYDLDSFLKDLFPDPKMEAPIDDEPKPVPISFYKDDDGVWTLVFHGKCLGWINRVKDEAQYRALSSITNKMERFYSLSVAREFLFAQSH